MPRTVRASLSPLGEVSVKRVADAEALLLRPALVDDRAVGPERRQHGVVALDPVEAEQAADRPGRRVDGLLVAERERAVLADRGDADAGVRRAPRDGRVGRRPAVGAGDHVRRRRCGRSSEPCVVSFRPAATTVTSGHQRDADHQRRRR